MSIALGVRVVRGPDWKWGRQDGGEGFVGTVVGLEEVCSEVVVQWDAGPRHRYRCGFGGIYDIRVIDNAPAGIQHGGVTCGWCCCPLIAGTLWQCVQCLRYWLCSRCYHAGKHSLEHEFKRNNGTDNQCVRVGSRLLARRAMSQGIFPGAMVMRGADWRWGNQDGGPGQEGYVAKIEGWEKESFRSVAHVKWSHSQSLNLYSVGHMGMVDLQCSMPSSGGYYYPEHLAILGEVCATDAESELSAGDAVRVELDPELFRAAQVDHGGWEDYMAEYIGRDGTVQGILYSGDVIVRYRNGKILHLNRDCLTQVECCSLDYGDVVRVCEDMAEVHRLQSEHGGWTDDMALALGQVGRVIKIRANGDISVAVNGSRWIFNPQCLTPASGEVPIEEKTDQLHVDIATRIQAQSLSEAGCADVVVVAADGGDVNTLTDYLTHHPDHVNTVYEGKAAIHVAVIEGYLPIVRLLIHDFNADINMKDEGELTALHLCAFLNSSAVAKLLIEGGADVNISDDDGVVPLATAAALGHMDVVRVLLDHPSIDPNIEDNEGNTPLHRAVSAHQLQSVIALIEAGADPTLSNHSLFNCIQRAAGVGFLVGVEELMKWHPSVINVAKKDGFTPLHITAINGYSDIVSLLASHPSCDINVKNIDGLTALHIAAHEGYPVMVERLVGYGAELNSATSEGNTALHLTLGRHSMSPPTDLSPRILEVKRELDILCGENILKPNVVVGVFLVREGANIHAVNQRGLHPLSVHPPDVAQLVTGYTTINTKPPFHGKLCQMESPFADVSPRTPRKPARVSRRPRSSAASPPSKPHGGVSDSHPAKNTINQAANVDPHSPILVYDKDINPYAKAPTESALDAVATADTCMLEPCSLCEDHPVCIMCQPCGHVLLCHMCGSRAKRCMKTECRAEVKMVVLLCPVCVRNQPEETHRACTEKHKLCRGCIARSSSKCLLCTAVLVKVAE